MKSVVALTVEGLVGGKGLCFQSSLEGKELKLTDNLNKDM